VTSFPDSRDSDCPSSQAVAPPPIMTMSFADVLSSEVRSLGLRRDL